MLSPVLIGEFRGLPEGDALYDDNGTEFNGNLWYVETTFGHPWIYLSLAEHEEEFWSATNEEDFANNGYSRENLISTAVQIKSAIFITENDYDLSEIPFHNVNIIE